MNKYNKETFMNRVHITTLSILLFSLSSWAMGQGIFEGVSTLPANISEEQKAAIEGMLKTYDVKLSPAVNELSKKVAFGIALPGELAIFLRLMGAAEMYAQEFAHKAIENSKKSEVPLSSESLTGILKELATRLSELKILKDANALHAAVLASSPQNPEISEWIKEVLSQSTPLETDLYKQAGIYEVSPLFLILFLGRVDLRNFLKPTDLMEAPVETLYRQDLIKAAEDKRKRGLWKPSAYYLQNIRSTPTEHTQEIVHIMSLIKSDAGFKAQFEKDNPLFYTWLIEKGQHTKET